MDNVIDCAQFITDCLEEMSRSNDYIIFIREKLVPYHYSYFYFEIIKDDQTYSLTKYNHHMIAQHSYSLPFPPTISHIENYLDFHVGSVFFFCIDDLVRYWKRI